MGRGFNGGYFSQQKATRGEGRGGGTEEFSEGAIFSETNFWGEVIFTGGAFIGGNIYWVYFHWG